MFRVREVQDKQGLALAQGIRYQVFVEEQGIDPSLEQDGIDIQCKHVIAWHGDSAIGTARLYVEGDAGRIGRMAVLPEFRRKGAGRRLLAALREVARGEGCNYVYVHAQLHAVPFYASQGFVAYGEEFVEAHVPHVCMRAFLAGGVHLDTTFDTEVSVP